MALHDPHATARYYVPRPRPEDLPPRAGERESALKPLRTRFTTAVAAIVFLGGIALACGVSLATHHRAQQWPATILVVSLVLVVGAVVEAARVVRHAKRELRR